jgi:lambda family phage tail tape measure protein
MAQIIAGLGAQLGLDTTEFRKGISEAKRSLGELKEYIPEALSAAAFIEMTHAAMEFSNKIVETAKANDVATASVLELSKALEENGGNAEDTSRIYSGFTAKMESAVMGNAKAQEAFARLGITLNDLRHLSEQDLFEKTVSALGNMKDAAERNGLAFETLGKSIRGVDLTGLAHTMEENKGSMDKYASAIEQAHELSLKLDAASRSLQLNFTNAFIPTMNALYDTFFKSGTVMETFFGWLKSGAQIVGDFVSAAVTALEHFGSVIKLIGKDLYALFDIREYTQGTFFKTLTQNLNDFTTTWSKDSDDYVASLAKIDEANKRIAKPPEKTDAKRDVIESYSKQLLAEKGLFDAYQKREQLNLEMLSQKEKDKMLTKNEVEMQNAVNAVLNNQQKELDAIDQKMSQIDKRRPGAGALQAELERQKTLVQVSTDYYVQQTQKVVTANQEARTKFETGWNEAFAQYKENAETMADVGKKSFNTVVDSMSTAMENFVKTGKLNFSDLAKSIIADLIQIQIKAQATQLFSGLLSGFGGGMFSGSTGPAPVETATPIMVSNATGGPLDAGQPSIVGENGPEVIVPRGNSTVIPNNQLGGMGSQTVQNVTNYNIQAIDTKSFEDRIYGSSGAIWAANQYATKNIATTRSRT